MRLRSQITNQNTNLEVVENIAQKLTLDFENEVKRHKTKNEKLESECKHLQQKTNDLDFVLKKDRKNNTEKKKRYAKMV